MHKKLIYIAVLNFIVLSVSAQQPKWTPEEQKELFAFCEKPMLINKLKISEEVANQVGEIDYWATQQRITVDANTNERFATYGEVEEEVTKKLKGLKLSGDQLKALTDRRREDLNSPKPCVVTTLSFNKQFDTMPQPRALQLYKTQYRKMLIDKIGINGRQADQVFETEVWKQKEAATIGAIAITDFERVRKTVAMHNQRDHRYKVIGLTDEQVQSAIQFFADNQIGPKQ